VTLAAVRGLIPSRAALVEFAVYRPYDPRLEIVSLRMESPLCGYVVRGQGEVGWRDLGPPAKRDRRTDQFIARRPSRSQAEGRPGNCRAVDAKVMLHFARFLGDATQLLLSPDGRIEFDSFEALVNDQGQYLVEGYSISYLTSGRDCAAHAGKGIKAIASPW